MKAQVTQKGIKGSQVQSRIKNLVFLSNFQEIKTSTYIYLLLKIVKFLLALSTLKALMQPIDVDRLVLGHSFRFQIVNRKQC